MPESPGGRNTAGAGGAGGQALNPEAEPLPQSGFEKPHSRDPAPAFPLIPHRRGQDGLARPHEAADAEPSAGGRLSGSPSGLGLRVWEPGRALLC